jgi:hypothetical protein
LDICVIIPGNHNYFHDLAGERVHEALSTLGHNSELITLQAYVTGKTKRRKYDLCLLVNTLEISVNYADSREAVKQLGNMRGNMGQMVAVALEAVNTHWFQNVIGVNQQIGVKTLWDIGFINQAKILPRNFGLRYQPIFNGLTASERADVEAQTALERPRPIPWAFVGHATPVRYKLVYQLSQKIATDGFVYIPKLDAIRKGGQHIDHERLMTVLNKTKWYVWSSHGSFAYVEHIRFRQALQAGGLPLKILQEPVNIPREVPFQYLIVPIEDLEAGLPNIPYEETLQRFRQEFLALPSLADAMASAVESL